MNTPKIKIKFLIIWLIILQFPLSTHSIDFFETKISNEPELIIFNGTIITMEDSQPLVKAIAIQGEKIIALGNKNEIFSLADSNTVIIDLEGKTLLPGFIDSHSHWIGDRNLVDQDTAQEAIDSILKNGWTSISELFVNQERIDELINLDENNNLKIRVNSYLPLSWQFQRFGDWYQSYQPGHEYSSKLRIAGVKIFMDRWVGNRTLLYFEQDELDSLVKEAYDLGYQIAIHTVSENASDVVLNAYEKVLGEDPNSEHRLRMEHLVFLRDDQIQRMKDLDILASFQLTWFNSDWANETVQYVGEENLSYISRWRDIVDKGIKSLGSTDFPWSDGPIGSVIQTIYSAVTRIGLLEVEPPNWMLNQRLTIEKVLRLITIDAAYGTFQEDVKGSIKIGKLADFVVLSENPLTVLENDLVNIDVVMTIIGGISEYCIDLYANICDSKKIVSNETSSSKITNETSTAIGFPFYLIFIGILVLYNKRKFKR